MTKSTELIVFEKLQPLEVFKDLEFYRSVNYDIETEEDIRRIEREKANKIARQ